MNVTKQAGAAAGGTPGAEELAAINALAREPLEAEQVYTFAIRLCDNQIDRDGERFAPRTLEELAHLFVGKAGIFDHRWSAREQSARIYRTQVVEEEGALTQAGDPCRYVKAWAYMVRTPGNQDLIAEIQGGIKREVSVGCAVEQVLCSVCGEPLESCPHRKGEVYQGKLCWGELVGATDAYEWSFVAVPAQRSAGVMKGFREEKSALEEEAALGRRWLKELREQVVALGVAEGRERPEMERLAGRCGGQELLTLKTLLDRPWGAPARPQLPYGGNEENVPGRDGAFLI